MIGTPVRGTLWYVEFEHRVVPVVPLTPEEQAAAPKTVTGHLHLLNADPSGADVYEVAKATVLNGKARDEHEFAVTHTKRLVEVRGRAIAAGGAN